jgi:hypothetical protein
MNTTLKRTCVASAAFFGLFLTQPVWAAPLPSNLIVPVAGIDSIGEIGDAANTRLSYLLQPGGDINFIRWDLGLTAFASSWLSDLAVSLTNSDGDGITLTPADTDAPGTGNFLGSVWLPDLGNNFSLGADGMLYLEFHEVLDDFAGADGRWDTGTLVIGSVPEPGTFGLLGAAFLAASLVSRRRTR